MYMAVPRDSPALSKLLNFTVFGSLWVREALGDILTSIVSNSHFVKRSVPRDETIFGFHVGLKKSEKKHCR